MSQFAICPKRHVWSADAIDAAESLVCPVCGEIGIVNSGTDSDSSKQFDTLVSTEIPSLAAGDHFAGNTFHLPLPQKPLTSIPAVEGYEVLSELGRGGMGVVYLARHLELKRLVALKMILAGAHADERTRSRFRGEAEAVARLQHPGIVQIHDVGELEGRSFLALEYINGSNLADFLNGVPLAALPAAILIESVARTMHYSHLQGIVHRDLTPRNILLAQVADSSGIRLRPQSVACVAPKITDFGLAKDLDCGAGQTHTGMVMGTPSYMAPEQAQGKNSEIGPHTDLYALGAVLYELLTGRPPFLAGSPLDTLRQVIDQDPVSPKQIQPGVPRDLETICLKCLNKEPHRRYNSAAELADDLVRFQRNEPILARPVHWSERLWKWGRRRPAVAGLLLTLCLFALTFVAGSLVYNARLRVERDRARQNLLVTLRAIDEMIVQVGEKQLVDEPGMVTKRRDLLSSALELYDLLLTQDRNDPGVQLATAQAWRGKADVLRLLEENGQAITAYKEAIAAFENLPNNSSANQWTQQQIAYCHNFMGEAFRAARMLPEAEQAYAEAELMLNQLVSSEPRRLGNADYAADWARAMYNRGILFKETGHLSEARKKLERAVELLKELVARVPEHTAYRQHLARAWLNLGTVLAREDRLDIAAAAYEHAIELQTPLVTEFPKSTEYRYELAVTLNNVGNLLSRSGRFEDALTKYDQSQRRLLTLVDEFPDVPLFQQELANTFNSVGNVQARDGDFKAAIEPWNEAARILGRMLEKDSELVALHGDLGMVQGNLGLAYLDQHDLQSAQHFLEEAIQHLVRVLSVSEEQDFFRQILRDNYQNLAEVLVLANDYPAAAIAAHSLADVFPESGQDAYIAACFLARCVRSTNPTANDANPAPLGDADPVADKALLMLRQAVERGFNDTSRIESDSRGALLNIASSKGYQEILEQLPIPASSAE